MVPTLSSHGLTSQGTGCGRQETAVPGRRAARGWLAGPFRTKARSLGLRVTSLKGLSGSFKFLK